MEIIGWVRRVVLGLPDRPPAAEFEAYRPIDQMFLDMRGRGTTVTRRDALRIPGVLKGRNLLCSISTLPLVERGPANALVRSPLLEQIDPNVANVVVLARTLEDLLFDGIAWWRVTARGFDNYPTSARRLDPGAVSLDPPRGRAPTGLEKPGTHVWIDGERVEARDVIRFDSPNPGLNEYAGETFRLALEYLDAARMYARNPQQTEHFKPAQGVDEMTDDEVREHLSRWVAARRRGATAYVPRALEYVPGTSPSAADQKLVELKQQAALETALCMGLDPEVLGVSTTSRTYANAQDWRRDRINDVLSAYMLAVTQRLSMGDVCRRGYVRTFDLDDYMRADPATRWSVYQQAVAMGAMTVEQVQQEEGLPVVGAVTPPSGGTPAVTPGPTGAPADDPAGEPVAASRGRAAQFDSPSTARSFEFRRVGFTVDGATRTIRGTALPYDEIASKYGLRFRFAKGSIEHADDVGRVKLLHNHDYAQPIGVATAINDTDAGLDTAFRVGAGPDRDALLQDASDGIVDGLSVGVEFDEAVDTVPDPDNEGVLLVRRATLREVSLTAMPAFDSARVTTVAASRDNGGSMDTCPTCGARLTPGVAHACTSTTPPATPPADPAAQFAEQFAAFEAWRTSQQNGPTVVDPAGPDNRRGPVFVNEAMPYRFDRRGNFATDNEHVFSADLHAMAMENDRYGNRTDAGRRVMAALAHAFDVDSTDANETHPTIQRPDMYVDQRDYRTPLWDSINRGGPPNGIQPFTFPKFNAASGLVGDHTEGTEPTGGTMTTTGQTVTPTGISGKAYLTREVWDMGGNPAVSNLVWQQMLKGYREGLETATATFLATLTAATDITLGVAVVDEALQAAWDSAIADLQFERGYDFDMFAVEKVLYKAFVNATDNNGRKLYAQINPTDANGRSTSRFTTLDLAGVTGVPSWALASTGGALNSSWLYDRSVIWGWATTPQRLDFPGGSDDNTTYQPVAKVGIGIWGYKAFANTDIGGVRQVTYDSVA